MQGSSVERVSVLQTQESVCTIMFFGSLLGSLLLQYTMLRKMNATVKNSAYSFGTLPLLVAIHVLRREVKLRREGCFSSQLFCCADAIGFVPTRMGFSCSAPQAARPCHIGLPAFVADVSLR